LLFCLVASGFQYSVIVSSEGHFGQKRQRTNRIAQSPGVLFFRDPVEYQRIVASCLRMSCWKHEEIAMHDLEWRAQHLLRDWQALRRDLERARQDHRVDSFYHAQLEAIGASIAALPEIIQCIAEVTAPYTSAPHDLTQTDRVSAGGLGTLLRSNRQAEDAWEDLSWSISGETLS